MKHNTFFIETDKDVDLFEKRLGSIIFDDRIDLESIEATTIVVQDDGEETYGGSIVTQFDSELYFASYFQVYFEILKLLLEVDDTSIKVEYIITRQEGFK